MIDIRQIRDNPQKFKDAARAKNFDVDIDRLLEVDRALKNLKQQIQDIVTDKNRLGRSIPTLSGERKKAALSELARLKKAQASDTPVRFRAEGPRAVGSCAGHNRH